MGFYCTTIAVPIAQQQESLHLILKIWFIAIDFLSFHENFVFKYKINR